MSKKEVISFEEAVALKNSGMLQPKPEPGQFWYNAVGSLVEIIEKNGDIYCIHLINDKEVESYQPEEFPLNGKEAFYAPFKKD